MLCGTLQRESLADFSKMVPDFKKVVPGLVTKHTAFVNRKCYGSFLCVYNQVISFALMLSEQRNRLRFATIQSEWNNGLNMTRVY